MSSTGQHQFDWPAGWEFWSRDGWCYYCGDTSKENGHDASPKSVTAEETNTYVREDSMNQPIKPSHTTPSASGSIPPGFAPVEEVEGTYEGKAMEGARWKIFTEWRLSTREFSLTFWPTDDEAMTVAEVQEFTAALVEMTDYLKTAEGDLIFGSEDVQ